jgi:peptide/nickel transport system substrate-binding protein
MMIRRFSIFVAGIAAAALVLAVVACGSETIVVETVIVEKSVQVEVVKTVEVEVPKIVEKIVIATVVPTAAPTALPPPSRAPLVKVATDGQLGQGGPESSIHPFHNVGAAGTLMYNRLINLTGSYDPIPQLAESWSANSDGTEWELKLRKGVTFHDGSDFTADDAVYSYAYMLDPENGAPGSSQFTRFMDQASMTKVDDYTVKITPLSAQAEIPLLLHSKEMSIIPEDSTFASLQTKSNGTGPYVMEDFEHTSQIWALDKFADYWEPDEPRTDTIEFFGIPDDTARAAAIQTGLADLLTAVGGAVKVAQVNALQNAEGVDLLIADNPAISLVLYMEIDTPPFDDINVRRALKMVADREFIANTVLNGLAFPGNDTPIPPFWPISFSGTHTAQNIDEAKNLLAEAGYNEDNPLELQLHVADIHAGALEMVQAFQEMAYEAGVDIELVTVPKSRYWDTSWLKNPFGISAWGIRPPSQALAIAYSSDSRWPETHWYRDDYDALLKQAEGTVDGVARANLYKEAQMLLNEEGGLINLLFTRPVDAIRSNCSGYAPPIPFYQRDFTTLECQTR